MKSLINCRGNPSREERILRPFAKPTGYLRVDIKGKSHRVHHLVLDAFVGPRPPGLECRHLDGNPGNNTVSNLCWGTRKENGEDVTRHGRKAGERSHKTKLSKQDLVEIVANRGFIPAYNLAEVYGVRRDYISSLQTGKRMPSHGANGLLSRYARTKASRAA